MTTLAVGSSVTVTVRDQGAVTIATNGGLGSVTVTPVGGTQSTFLFGPDPQRRVFGPYSEGAALTISNSNCQSFDYDVPGVVNSDFLGSYAWAGLPDPTLYAGYRARVTDGGPTGGIYVVSDGVRWKPINGAANLKTLAAAVSGIANTETIVLQTLVPAGLLQANDVLRIWHTMNKSGATDTGLVSVRIGAAGTTADTAITGLSAIANLSAAQLSGGYVYDVKLLSATSAQRVGSSGAQAGTYWTSTAAESGATTISSASANALWVSLSVASGGATNTVGVDSASIQIVTP